MKKMMLIGALLLGSAVGYAQESRLDVSLSGFGLIAPNVQGNGVNPIREMGDVEVMGLAAFSRLEPFATHAKQPALNQCLVVRTVIDADP